MKATSAGVAGRKGLIPFFQLLGNIAVVLGLVVLLSGCDAEIKDQKISENASGEANDGDPQTPPAKYPPGLNGADAATTASSTAPRFNQLSGNAHAVLPAVANQPAVAKSFNRVLSRLVVTNANAFTFDINLDVQGVQLQGLGHVDLFVQANVLDATGQVLLQNGQPVPNCNITSMNFEMKLDAQGTPLVIIENDTANPEHLNGNNYPRRISGPNGGVNLGPGNYTVELELRVIAHAPVDPRSQADVNSVTATIVLR